MKKIVAVFLTLFLVLMLFACNGNNQDGESDPSNGNASDVSNVSETSDTSDEPEVSDVSHSDESNTSEESNTDVSAEESNIDVSSEVSIDDTSEPEVSEDVSEDPKNEVQIVIPFEKLTLKKGQQYTFTPDITGADGQEIVFKSSNTQVAEVDENRQIQAISKGECIISVAVGEVSESFKLTVIDDNLTKTPTVNDYVYIDYNSFVLLGTCEQDATIKVSYAGKVITESSDHGYFSVRIADSSQTLDLNVTATVSGKSESEPLKYTVKKESPNFQKRSDLWRVIAGSDYQFHLRDYGYLDSFLRTNPFSQTLLDNIKYKINLKVLQVKQYNPDAELIYMVIPSPATIYPETMPKEYIPHDNESRIEQVYKVIEESEAVLIDVRSALEEHKNDDLKIYWKTDSHWTDYGAYIAYTELFDYIKTRFPDAAPRSMDEFNFVEDYYYGGDFAYYLLQDEKEMREYNALRVPEFDMPTQITSIKRYVSDKKLTYTHGIVSESHLIATDRSNLPTAVILRDSYNTQLFDILAERFNTTIYNRMWDYTLYDGILRSYKPDYVIIMGVERNIESMFR